ncbi:hypothetical protein SAMN04244579_00478 [Azotobacter beijerinckii]|uniref:Uncharacterized protein n=1 Tax=Azotobacter beijerinckii TaxID=170623 RepID=A0A1H6QKB2_9GAMM|nr:hypothetical protein SAMN04244579_00478 [Azotobacter beijerinckii]
MRAWLHEKSQGIFALTLIIYIIIWCTVSYIGVYVTYVAGPTLLITGIIMLFTSPKKNNKENA